MRKLLLLALLLYDIVALATRSGNYDYDDVDGSKRHALEDRRNWRKKALMGPEEHKDWERRRHDYDTNRFLEEMEGKSFGDRQRDPDLSGYRGARRYESDSEKGNVGMKSSSEHLPFNMEKDQDKKNLAMNCDRQHERYETCFAGCAAVTCDNPRDRLRPCYPFCEPGCVCAPPYVRDDRTHKCVLPDDCTKGLKGIPDLGDEI